MLILMKKLILIITLLPLLCGCATLSDEFIRKHGQPVEVTSNPPGAKIEVNDDYLGDAPCVMYLYRPRGMYGMRASVTIKAYPSQVGQYVQTKYLDVYENTPKRLYFDMYLGRAPIKIELK